MHRILVNLGYNINFGVRSSTSATNYGREFSALPLLAFYRIWCDFFQYKMSTTYREYDPSMTDSAGYYLAMSLLRPITETLTSLGSLYDDDYFTLAGESPNIPVYDDNNSANLAYNNMQINTENYDGVANNEIVGNRVNSGGTSTKEPTLIEQDGTVKPSAFGASALNALQRAADYFMRKFKGGSTVVQQYFNEYGIKLKAEEITHAKHIGSFESPIQINDIVSTGDYKSTLGGLGAVSSVARGAGQSQFSWTADEFGYIIVTAVVVAHGLYNHGTPRLATRLAPLDFYHPDFDGLGMQAVRMDELASGTLTAPNDYYNPTAVFGFLPTYSDWKYGHDTLSGDFILRSKAESLSSYYLTRWYKPSDFTENPPHAGETFRNPNAYQNGWTPTSFDNIFIDKDSDNFRLFYAFDYKATNNVRPLMDSYDWYADGETQVVQNGGNNFGDN